LNLRWGSRIARTLASEARRRIPPGEARYGDAVFEERPANVAELRPLAIHGLPYVDVALALDDGSSLSARLGPEALPDGLAVGDRVVAVTVMANVIELRRAEPPAGG
jgi:hypothetical protein